MVAGLNGSSGIAQCKHGLTQGKRTFNKLSQEVDTPADPPSAAVFARLMFRERLNNDA